MPSRIACPHCHRPEMVQLAQVIATTYAYACGACDHEWLIIESDAPASQPHERRLGRNAGEAGTETPLTYAAH